MSELYSQYPDSNFPNSIDTFNRVTDVTASLLPLVQRYNNLYSSGKIDEAYNILKTNPELQNCIINAQTINKCYDAIQCIENYYYSDVQKYLEQIIKFRSDYSTKNIYHKYDVCLYDGSAYLCIAESPIGILPTDRDHFVPITLRGERGFNGLGLSFCGTWDRNFIYSSDSCVEYNNCLFASIQDNNVSHTPAVGSSFWTVVVDFKEIAAFDNSKSNLTSTTIQDAIEEINTKITNLNYVENSNYANSAGSATTASSCTGNSATATKATNADYAINAVSATNSTNADKVDGYHFMASTTALTPNVSTLSSNTIYIQYE